MLADVEVFALRFVKSVSESVPKQVLLLELVLVSVVEHLLNNFADFLCVKDWFGLHIGYLLHDLPQKLVSD